MRLSKSAYCALCRGDTVHNLLYNYILDYTSSSKTQQVLFFSDAAEVHPLYIMVVSVPLPWPEAQNSYNPLLSIQCILSIQRQHTLKCSGHEH